MTCVAAPAQVVGPTATRYVLPLVSVMEFTLDVESFHPTTTTFRSPAFCAAAYFTPTELADTGT